MLKKQRKYVIICAYDYRLKQIRNIEQKTKPYHQDSHSLLYEMIIATQFFMDIKKIIYAARTSKNINKLRQNHS